MPTAIHLCVRNVAACTVLLSLAVYLLLFIFVCFLTVCFWRNKDAQNIIHHLPVKFQHNGACTIEL